MMTSAPASSSSDGGSSSGDAIASSESTGADTSSSSSAGESSSGGEVPSSVPGRDCPPDSFLDATNFGMPFITTWCTGCHSSDLVGDDERQLAPPEWDFDSLDAIRASVLMVYLNAADEHEDMPPAGGPSAEERALLGDWLACGAP
ncbi:MAG TPA: hypothetical protein VG755_28380 [Nannocystaceae bacterium]|nr:hypothetical protein [Nannocystaceae bacterium]